MTETQIRFSLSSNLRSLRIHFGLTQDEVGKLCGFTKQAVSRWEVGTAEPSYAVLIKLCDFYDVTLDSLRTLTQEQIDKLPQIDLTDRLHNRDKEFQDA